MSSRKITQSDMYIVQQRLPALARFSFYHFSDLVTPALWALVMKYQGEVIKIILTFVSFANNLSS